MTHTHIWVRGDIRAGRTPDQRTSLMLNIMQDISEITGLNEDNIWVYLCNFAPTDMVEYGHVGCRVTPFIRSSTTPCSLSFPVQIARVKNSLLKHLVLLVALLGGASGANAMANVRIEFVKPENYTDVSFRSMTPEGARERLIGELARHTRLLPRLHFPSARSWLHHRYRGFAVPG